MSKRWSKLQREIYNLLDDSINLQIHCGVYRMNSPRGSTVLPRYWITLDKDIIFDYPKQFLNKKLSDYGRSGSGPEYQIVEERYPYITKISTISNIIRDYIDTPLLSLLFCQFEHDEWGITEILKAADRRIGKNKLLEFFQENENYAVNKILTARNIIGN